MIKRVVALVLVGVAVAAISAGVHARGLVTENLTAQRILMPGTPAIETQVRTGMLTDEDAAALTRYAAQPMTNGLQAKVYAENYIAAQMRFSARNLGVADEDATFARLALLVSEQTEALRQELREDPRNAHRSDTQIAAMVSREIATSNSEYEHARRAAALQRLRLDTFLPGDTLRGLLLNAYGWWMVGSIALITGIFSLVGGGVLLVLSFLRQTDKPIEQRRKPAEPLLL